MVVTQSELQLIEVLLRHLRTYDFANVEISRRGEDTFISIGYSIKLKVRYVGSMEKGTEGYIQLEIA